jgi:pterin-4a-carbinolamine dehydratase
MSYKVCLPYWLKPVTSKDLIRIGRDFDGGYLVQKSEIIDRKVLISFGVNDDWSFESDFLRINKNSKVYMFDKSVSFIQLIKLLLKNIFHLPNIFPLLNSIKSIFTYHYFFSKKNVKFFPLFVGRRIENESKTFIECIDLIESNNSELILKIDIEGSEYRILNDLVSKKHLIEILIIEFHDIDIHLEKINKFLNEMSLNITHVHVNNYSRPDISGLPKDIEITLQKHFVSDNDLTTSYPLINDMPSNRLKPDLKIEWI